MASDQKGRLKPAPAFVRLIGLVSLILLGACTDHPADPAQDLQRALQTMKEADRSKSSVHSFAASAAAGDIEALVRSFDPAVLKAVPESQLREYLTTTVIPFFEDFSRVDTYETVAPAGLPDGRVGVVHYTYIESTAGQKKPFSIALIGEGDAAGVVNITVGECVKDRHPVSEGRCD